jgi:pimeloyl-ACP methyl ester carboxylesterase
MAAPSCFITTFLCNLENELPADVEQYPPGVLGAGLEMADILYAAAPKPILLLGQLHDYFDVRGLRWAHGELRRLYRILGAPDRDIRLFVGPRPHGFYVENQEAMVAFFMQHARMGRMKSIPQTANRSVQELATTPDADVVKAGSRPSYELIAEAADRLAAGRKALSRSALRQALRRLLRITGRKSVPHYRILPVRKIADVSISRYAVETEPNIVGILKTPVAPCAPQLVFDDRKEAILYIPHLASEIELETEPLVKTLLQKERVYLIDPRGLGESMPEPPDEFFAPYGMDYMMHGHGILFGESYLGGRVRDVLAAMDLMASEGAKRIHLAGRGQGAVIALFAALLHPKAGTVTLKNGPLSYDEWAHSILVQWPAATAPRGVLKHFDIPDCIRALGDRVCLIEPWNPEMRPYNAATLQTAMACFRLPMSLVKTEM